MNMKIKTKLGLGFGMQVFFTTVLGIGVLLGMLAVKSQFRFVVEHDAPVIANAMHLSKLVVDQETGQRGFCITHREDFLEPYTKGAKEFNALIEVEKELVSDNPKQVAALERIERLVYEWETKAAKPEITMARKVATHVIDAEHLQDVLGQGVGKELMDRIMALGHEIEVAFSGQEDWEGAFAIEVIEKCMVDREDGQRGFLITGKEEFLEKYNAGEQKKLPEWFDRLRVIISNRGRGDELSEKVDRLEQLTHEWTEKAAEPEIAARREMNRHPESLKDVAALLEARTGKVLLDEIRREFDEFIEIETRLASHRYDNAVAMTILTRNVAAGLLICAVCVGFLIFRLTIRAVAVPLAELARGAQAIGRGNLDTRINIKSSDEIGVLSLSFNAMALSLKEADSERQVAEKNLSKAIETANAANLAKSEFLANMSHEIRTPMAAILGFSNILTESELNHEQLDAATTIKRNGEYLIELINDILDLSKIEAGKLIIEQTNCSPCQILSEVLSLMKVRADAKNLSLNLEYDGPVPQSIQTDPIRLRQILINLISNAIKFTDMGNIRLVARLLDADSVEPKIQFDVVDSGIGITEKQKAELFQPFSQVDTSATRRQSGTGLGLTISRRLAKKLGGDITVESTFGEGSTFTITIKTDPLERVKLLDNPTEARISTELNKNPTAPQTELNYRVLLAEDGPDNQRLISFVLKKAGAKVTVAENGQVANDLALAARDEGTPFDLILMDMQMPVLNGYDATRRLREAAYAGPIVALTANAMSDDRQKCLNVGCDDYTTKPIDRKKLVAIVAEYASRQEIYDASKDLVT
jgi:signal transduction histidine kinase/AmiR/NasT family two-component response regulator